MLCLCIAACKKGDNTGEIPAPASIVGDVKMYITDVMHVYYIRKTRMKFLTTANGLTYSAFES